MSNQIKRPIARFIDLRGLRTHNLKSIDLELPLGKCIVVTGVSGAGKSSLALDTLYAEGQRRYVETFSPYTRQFLAKLDKPPAERIDGIPPAIAFGQPQRRQTSRSTVGTLTEIHDALGLLFARIGQVNCRNCGNLIEPASPASVVRKIEEWPEGARYEIAFPIDVRSETDRPALTKSLLAAGFTRLRVDGQAVLLDEGGIHVPDNVAIEGVVDRLVRGKDPVQRRTDSIEIAFEKGLGRCWVIAGDKIHKHARGWRCQHCGTDHLEPQRSLFQYNSSLGACPTCKGFGRSVEFDLSRVEQCPACEGARLRPEALAVRIEGRNIVEILSWTIRETRRFIAELAIQDRPMDAGAILGQVDRRLASLVDVGLDYLTLDRPAGTLSTGEFQRVSLTKTLGSGLVNTLYVLDEPTRGLHPHEIGKLIGVLHRLRDQGNTLVVVEHEPEVIRSADHVVDLGPGAGAAGGQVVFSGPVSGLLQVDGSATGDFIAGRKRTLFTGPRRPVTERSIRLVGASGNNLRSIDVRFPLGLFTVVTGVSGSGKSTLIEDTLYPALCHQLSHDAEPRALYHELIVAGDIADVVFLDQSPLARSARSNPATHLKASDEIRKTFAATHEAKLRNYDAGRFSFNVDGGRCNVCQGRGFLSIDMQFLPDVMVRCPECRGVRYRPEILEVTYRGKNIAEVLDLTVREAFGFFRNRPKVQARLRPMLDIGLDYLTLGQPVSTLSGGKAQRLKLAGFLARSTAALNRPGAAPHTVYLLDEPTAGLHPLDIVKLLETLSSLVDRGHSVIVIEYRPELMIAADWIIDLGPGAGEKGGQLVAYGTPEAVAATGTFTGQVLKKMAENGALSRAKSAVFPSSEPSHLNTND